MPFLFVDSLAENNYSRFVQISGKILELLLLSMGLISSVVVMKEAVYEIVFSSLMGFWNSITCFLSSPLSIIFAINLMVILILASSAFSRRRQQPYDQHQQTTTLLDVDVDDLVEPPPIWDDVVEATPPPPPPPYAPPIWDVVEATQPPPTSAPPICDAVPQPPPSAPPIWDVVQVTPPPQPPSRNSSSSTSLQRSSGTSWYHDASSTQVLVGKATLPSPKDQPEETSTVTAAVPNPLEKWKDVFVEEEGDNTLDATWEAIIGGGKPKPKSKPKPKPKPMPKKTPLKKSETWDAPPPPPRRLDSEEVVPTSPKWRELRKAETFNDAVSLTRRGGLVRRDPSMSLEDFNRKVERFIKNFNDGIRLQRQESYRRFLDIINQKRA
ncbi:uncharacterized protein LOC131023227 [Salvia miltiorrhiza]|uniref:uncharacterized protein LOC131023227 n=1 Tax=Salvia miltiorrhiza TaxID=226208 RepID=UPI0025ABB6FB|nr:uncharacterized protein LOC131023227 [Salvia miltiorrhiza]